MVTVHSKLLSLLFCVWFNVLAESETEFKEKRYTVAPGIEGYVIEIPINDNRLQYFLNGGKTELHRRFERDHGLKDDYDVFGDLKAVLQRRRRDLPKRKKPVNSCYQNETRTVRQIWDYVRKEDDVKYLNLPFEPLSKVDFFVPCKPYSKIVPTSFLADDKDTYLVPYCMEVPTCQGCCGQRTCKPKEKGSKSYYYKVWKGDINHLVPTEQLRSFTVTYDKTCVLECEQTPKDCGVRQHYDPDLCKCTCGRVSECNPKTHHWNNEECQCQCNEDLVTDCKAGYYFAHGDCSCHKTFFEKYPTAEEKEAKG